MRRPWPISALIKPNTSTVSVIIPSILPVSRCRCRPRAQSGCPSCRDQPPPHSRLKNPRLLLSRATCRMMCEFLSALVTVPLSPPPPDLVDPWPPTLRHVIQLRLDDVGRGRVWSMHTSAHFFRPAGHEAAGAPGRYGTWEICSIDPARNAIFDQRPDGGVELRERMVLRRPSRRYSWAARVPGASAARDPGGRRVRS